MIAPLALLCAAVTAKAYRVEWIGIDAYHPNRQPKTERYCCICQRDIKPGAKAREVHLVDGGMWALHPDDEALYTDDGGDLGMHLLGLDCAKKLGSDWSRPENDWTKGTP